jgi:Tfp pilus tip-associated adhesin PilY1
MVSTDKTNAYTDNICSLAGRYRSTYQTRRQVSFLTKDTTRTTKRTIQYTQSTSQSLATTTQTTRLVQQQSRTTQQFAERREYWVEERYQHVMRQTQTTQVREQYELQTSQQLAQTFQTNRVDTQTWRTREQWNTAKQQLFTTTTQYLMQTDQFKLGRRQVQKYQYQTIAYDKSAEHGDAIPGNCVPSPGNYPIECRVTVVFPAQFVDPSSCNAGVGAAPTYIKTDCTPGPMSLAYQPVASCTPGVTPAAPGNSFVETTCDRISVSPPTAFNGTCVDGATTQGPAPDYFLYTCTRPAGTNSSVAVASCGAAPPASGPNWITTTCGPSGPNNQPATPSLPCTVGSPTTDAAFVTTTCTKPIDESGYAATCTPDPGTSAPFIKVTCTPTTLTNTPVPSASCSPGTGPGPDFIVTTCPKTAAGPMATQAAVASCNPGATTGSPDYYETTCTSPPATNKTEFVTAAACGSLGVTPGTAPNWITRDCRKPAGINNSSGFADPTLCIADPGTSFPYLKVDCNTVQTMPPTVVDPATTCTSFGTTVGPAPGYLTTICQRQGVSPPTNVGACVPGVGPAPDYIVTTCGFGSFDTPVSSCVPGSTWTEGIYKVTCVLPGGANNATVFVPPGTCTAPAAAAPNWVHVTCSAVNTISNGFVDPATCTVPYSVGPGPNFYGTTCTTVGVAPYPTPTPVPSPCVDSLDGSMVKTTCSAANTPATPSAPCTVGPTTNGSHVTTTCAVSDTTEYVPTATCANQTQSGTGPEVICTTTTTLGTPATTCSAGAVDGAPYYDTTIPGTGCHNTVTSPMADYAGVCTPGPTATLGEIVACGRGPAIDNMVSDSACVDGVNPSTGLITECTNQANPGRTYAVVTTQTVTTTQYSGTVPIGPGSVVTTVGPSTPLAGGQCLGSPPPMPAQPPVDIAGCSAWPCVSIVANAGGSRNSLADVAQYYYKTDLRTSMVDNVIPAGPNAEDDNAPHQHMTTFTLGLGVSGTLRYRSDYRDLATTTGDFAEIRAGTRDWPLWPDPAVDYTDALNYNNPKSVDDFWHTAVTGRGTYFNASFPSEAVQGLGDALSKVEDRVGSGTGEAVSTVTPVAGNNFAFSTTYTSGRWSGDLLARVIDLGTGAAGPSVWSAKAKLGSRVFAACDDRNIYLIRGGSTLVDFTWETQRCPGGTPSGVPTTALNAAEKAFFGPSGPSSVAQLSQHAFMTDGAGGTALQRQAAEAPGVLLNFLRGQTGHEGFVTNSATKLFRTRDGALGDIVNSQPVYVKQPFANYLENDYATFKATSRTPMVYVGANDGMLHAFYATLDPLDPLRGQEAWAVVPSAVLPNMWKLADDDYKRDGHRYYVDGSPIAGDIWTGSAWKTLLVGGLNAGGKGYYALDVTTPGSAPVARWEFKQSATCAPAAPAAMPLNTYTSDCNLGYTFGKPVITKLAGTWVVMFTSGYNNVNGVSGDGGGYLYVVNAWNGTLIHKIPTGAGDATTPSGLAQINNYVDDVMVDNTTRRVYGGDALGNMWRFDFTPNPVATRLGTTSARATGLPQPITVRPELAELDGKPFVMFGTGRLLGTSDVGDAQVQSVYGFRDTLSLSAPIYPDPLRNVLRKMQITAGGSAQANRSVTCSASCGQTEGWVVDLLEAGERVNVDMKLVNGALVFASNVPETIPCQFGGHSWFNQVDFRTGAEVPTATFTSQYLNDALNVGFNILQLPVAAGSNNPSYIGLFRQSNATNLNSRVFPPEPVAAGRRITWREIAQ